MESNGRNGNRELISTKSFEIIALTIKEKETRLFDSNRFQVEATKNTGFSAESTLNCPKPLRKKTPLYPRVDTTCHSRTCNQKFSIPLKHEFYSDSNGSSLEAPIPNVKAVLMMPKSQTTMQLFLRKFRNFQFNQRRKISRMDFGGKAFIAVLSRM